MAGTGESFELCFSATKRRNPHFAGPRSQLPTSTLETVDLHRISNNAKGKVKRLCRFHLQEFQEGNLTATMNDLVSKFTIVFGNKIIQLSLSEVPNSTTNSTIFSFLLIEFTPQCEQTYQGAICSLSNAKSQNSVSKCLYENDKYRLCLIAFFPAKPIEVFPISINARIPFHSNLLPVSFSNVTSQTGSSMAELQSSDLSQSHIGYECKEEEQCTAQDYPEASECEVFYWVE